MMAALAILALHACGVATPEHTLVPGEPARVAQALAVADPSELLALVDEPESILPMSPACPTIENHDGVELWTGGCETPEGLRIEGTLRRGEGDLGWFAAEDFTVRADDGAMVLALDGAVELGGEGDLLVVDATLSVCGIGPFDCEAGPATLDLTTTLFPATGYPRSYDATVTGMLRGPDGVPLAIDGAWSRDEAACALEAASGTFTVRAEHAQGIELDGAVACDGCAAWTVQGVPVDRYCGL